ncbi:ADP-ribosylglycohydrolase [Rhodococcus phage Weasels2]|uniref:ADP-ribosylglycohydrolase n=1 Tax=Rhodococcus phage Weasels2 TaxID=1897437 RepID=A0A1I9SA26_9CAUD|nr:ADP-ribosylglycohydrolase [Rhodococcus phage Weasels2]AOZ63632.1 ADP-ribosylglycohydrolase [Rhodococcus phage Weasels2]
MSWIGCLKGIAFGDAWGNANEFLSAEEIYLWGDPTPPEKFIVTDDTQMTLYLADALEHPAPFEARVFKIREKFIEWLHDPDNDRYPGDTCLESIRSLELHEPVENDSKGNGSLMRVFPCAYTKKRYKHTLAKAQSELTHKHSSATGSCVIAINMVVSSQLKMINSRTALDRAFVSSAHYPEVQAALGKAIEYRDNPEIFQYQTECEYIGEGWIAEEALALALYYLGLKAPALVRLGLAATCAGDSDTIAAITGGFIGAFEGDVWPEDWINRLEPRYKAWITKEWNIK